MKCGWGGGSNTGDDGRRGRRRGTGFWKGKTSQSIDGSSTCTCAPPRSVPCPARLESRSFPLYGFSRRRCRVGKECGSAHSPAPPRLSHSSRVCHLAAARCSAHHTITSLIGISILERTLITAHHMYCICLYFFSNCDMYQIKSEHIMECPRSSDVRTCVSCVRE